MYSHYIIIIAFYKIKVACDSDLPQKNKEYILQIFTFFCFILNDLGFYSSGLLSGEIICVVYKKKESQKIFPHHKLNTKGTQEVPVFALKAYTIKQYFMCFLFFFFVEGLFDKEATAEQTKLYFLFYEDNFQQIFALHYPFVCLFAKCCYSKPFNNLQCL